MTRSPGIRSDIVDDVSDTQIDGTEVPGDRHTLWRSFDRPAIEDER